MEQIAARLIKISLIFKKVDLNAALVVLVHALHSIYLELHNFLRGMRIHTSRIHRL